MCVWFVGVVGGSPKTSLKVVPWRDQILRDESEWRNKIHKYNVRKEEKQKKKDEEEKSS